LPVNGMDDEIICHHFVEYVEVTGLYCFKVETCKSLVFCEGHNLF
jgi:hypothetical protein